MEDYIKIIDLKAGLRKSKNKFIRNLPNFVVKALAHTIREKSMNDAYQNYKHLEGMEFVKALLFEEFKVTINITGQENVDKTKKHVYIANHPLGAVDALSFLYLVDNVQGKVVSPSNELFENIPNLHSLIVGINVFGQNTKDKIKKVNEAFETDAQMMIFPAGEVSRKINGNIIDPQWQKTFVSKAVEYKRDIVPVYISGQNSNKFYRTAKIRKFFGFKTYFETILLPQEMMKQRGITLDMKIGKTICWSEIKESKKSHVEWTEKIKSYVYSLSN
ncbi:MAG: 1-acyl-sn-glycerol-3-phosphate acyltransferase [Bacteroidales bacterium]|nr:1-acyl-sn-glycerol-3-phosphate acyltransferase [Bacteroidales bacterium]